jgi:hypothetical protein
LLTTTNKEILSTVDQDLNYDQFAGRQFPLYLMDTSIYENSWKELVQDDNTKNGCYRLQLNSTLLAILEKKQQCNDDK